MTITIRRLLTCAALLGLLVLAACASISKDACRAGDWAGIGFTDGANGRAPSYIEQHQKACAKVDVAPDVTGWLAGRTEGLQTYCTPASAYRVARRGAAIAPYCSAAQLTDMRPAIDRGRLYYDLERDIEDMRQDLRDIDRYLLAVPETGAGKGAWLAHERLRLQHRIFTLENRQRSYAYWSG
jgi:hypothetical protein